MNRIINKRQAVCGTVWVIIVCAVLSMWPLRLIKETIVSDSNRQMVMESGEIVSGSAVQQMFAAQYDRLKNINIYITEGTIGEEFNFVLYDAAMGVIMQQVINTKDMKSIPGDCRVQVNIDTEVGQAYYFAVQGMESPFRTGFEETEASGNPYNGAAFYGGVEDREHSMIASYEYEIPLRKGRTLVWDALFVLSGIAVTYLTGIYYKKHPEKHAGHGGENRESGVQSADRAECGRGLRGCLALPSFFHQYSIQCVFCGEYSAVSSIFALCGQP